MLDSTLELMKSNKAKRVTDNCEFRLKAFALGPTGEQKGKCMMGDNADCDRCGCIVPFHMATLSNRRLMIKEAVKRLASWIVLNSRSTEACKDRQYTGKNDRTYKWTP